MTEPLTCRSCAAPLVAGGHYCHRCGRAVTGGGSSERTPWAIAWALVALSTAVIAWSVLGRDPSAGAAPPMAQTGTPPDISQMSPRDRFLRLHDRVLGAAERGDSATVRQFAPMAITAYGMLDSYDDDLRFHAGLIYLQLGRADAAVALADTIQAGTPGHLLAEILRADAAELRGDLKERNRSRRVFLANFDREIATGRPEYGEHRRVLDAFRVRAGSP
ncbi:MAG: hypothetical protein OEW17_01485 [Gemmatimonadota bacterium]|nr:hypothetical protein [Gemmatimonadota bacterium]MDH4347453.1 hypothetical protein [Gemmatimonadota bacterium]MDH5282336.1 hypothetical protein [Gemmatimonadota bacterium]